MCQEYYADKKGIACMRKLVVPLLLVYLLTGCTGGNAGPVSGPSSTQQGITSQSKPSESNPPQNTASSGSQSTLVQPETSTPANEIKVTVDLPEGWEPVEGSDLPAHYIKNGSAVFMVTKLGYSGDTIDAVTELAKASNEKSYEKVEYEGGTESVKVGGREARKFVCTYGFGGLAMKSMFVYFFYGRDTYVIAFNDYSDSYDALSDDYAAILAQIKFE